MKLVSHYCVNCGTRLEARIVENREVEGCSTCSFVLWRDPKVVTLIVVEDGAGRVVVGRRGIEPAYGRWCLPGGYVNDDEHPADSAVRECREEIGADVDITQLLGVYHIRKLGAPSMVGIAYGARLRPGQVPVAGSEMLEVVAFLPDGLPELAFASHREAMSDWLRRGEQFEAIPT
jgi:ADP-ribose pyrophosphatase YjhB (NUDIX family)